MFCLWWPLRSVVTKPMVRSSPQQQLGGDGGLFHADRAGQLGDRRWLGQDQQPAGCGQRLQSGRHRSRAFKNALPVFGVGISLADAGGRVHA